MDDIEIVIRTLTAIAIAILGIAGFLLYIGNRTDIEDD